MSRYRTLMAAAVAGVLTTSLVATASPRPMGSQAAAAAPEAAATAPQPDDPGTAPWVEVPRADLAAACSLDPARLDATAAEFADTPVAVFRYGKLCWSSGGAATTESYSVFSVTKTLSAVVFGIIAGRTELKDDDLVSEWLEPAEMGRIGPDNKTYLGQINPQAKVAHVLAMAGTSADLSTGKKDDFSYDGTGDREINRLITIMDRAVQRSPEAFPGLTSAAEVARRELFVPLGMTSSTWPGGTVGLSMYSSVQDMGRLGLLLLRKGHWNGRQILDEDYVYRMTHPSFEDSNTGYGYLTWLNATGDKADTGAGNGTELTCTPFAAWQRYPHPPTFEAKDNYGGSPYAHTYDIGAFEAVGLFGQMIYVHRGLDLVITIRADGSGEPQRAWNLIRPALVALDPVYQGDEAAFCEAYRRSAYAPSLLSPWNPDSGFGAIDDQLDPSTNTDPAPPKTGPAGLEPHRNNVGIGRLGTGGADFDRTGTGYLDLFLTAGGIPVRPGDSFTSHGFTFKLPALGAGQPDNVVGGGQTVFPGGPPRRATRLGLLGAGYGGSTTGTLTMNYVDGQVRVPVRLPDWLYDGDLRKQAPGTAVALHGRVAPIPGDRAWMWSVSVPLDPQRKLRSVTLPHHVGFHVFDLQVQ